ncbi:MAG: isoprenylcysteine carboxylmethyltransferase family protein [Gemmatimonadota bacterium]
MRLFRPAREASAVWNLAKTAAQTSLFWAGLLWFVPFWIRRLEGGAGIEAFSVSPVLGGAILVLSSLGGLWSGWTMATVGRGTPLPIDTARELVTSGPYALVRNPMAVTGLSQGIGVALLIGSWSAIAYVVAGGLLWHVLVRPMEEAELEERFGGSYRTYRQRVPLWLPRRRTS